MGAEWGHQGPESPKLKGGLKNRGITLNTGPLWHSRGAGGGGGLRGAPTPAAEKGPLDCRGVLGLGDGQSGREQSVVCRRQADLSLSGRERTRSKAACFCALGTRAPASSYQPPKLRPPPSSGGWDFSRAGGALPGCGRPGGLGLGRVGPCLRLLALLSQARVCGSGCA